MASPFEKATGWIGNIADDYKKKIEKQSFAENALDTAKFLPIVGPHVRSADWLFSDPQKADSQALIPQSKRDNPWANKYYSDLQEQQDQRIRARQQSMQELREIAANRLTNEDVRMRARKQVAPVFRPQIRETKRSIRQTEKQGRVAATQVQGYYEQAGNKVAGMGKSAGQSARKAAKRTVAGGVQGNASASKESRIAAKAIKGMGKANASFFKQLQGALAGEGAVASADTRKNYKDQANEYRGDLADIRTQRAAAMQQVMGKIRGGVNSKARNVYENTYLSAIQQGMSPVQAQRAALAQAGTYGDAVKAKAAQMMLKNKGDEKLLAQMQKKQGMNKEQFDQWAKKQELAQKDLAELRQEYLMYKDQDNTEAMAVISAEINSRRGRNVKK
jgi:hypothetical protein